MPRPFRICTGSARATVRLSGMCAAIRVRACAFGSPEFKAAYDAAMAPGEGRTVNGLPGVAHRAIGIATHGEADRTRLAKEAMGKLSKGNTENNLFLT